MSRLPSSFLVPVRRVLMIAVPIAISFYSPEPSRACSVATSAEAQSVPGCASSACAGEIPRNAVFFESSVAIEGVPTATAPVPDETYFELPNLLEAGVSVTAGSTTATVGDFLDADPPAGPELLSAFERRLGDGGGCGASSSCDGVEVLEIEVSLGADDVAATSALTLLVYFGGSATEVASQSVPSLRLVPPVATTPSSTFTTAPVAATWVAVETMDQAGNRSGRTLAVRVTR